MGVPGDTWFDWGWKSDEEKPKPEPKLIEVVLGNGTVVRMSPRAAEEWFGKKCDSGEADEMAATDPTT